VPIYTNLTTLSAHSYSFLLEEEEAVQEEERGRQRQRTPGLSRVVMMMSFICSCRNKN
jgi:hypothetical protein